MTTIFNNLPKLITNRLILRKIQIDDVDALYAFTSDDEVTKFMTWGTHNKKETTEEYVNYLIKQYSIGESADWGIEYKGKIIGLCSYIDWNEKDKRAEIGYVLNRKYWGKGIMAEAVKAVIEYGFKDKDLNRIEARCDDDNDNSEKVMKKVEMELEGTLRKDRYIKGKFRNTKVYSILREDYEI